MSKSVETEGIAARKHVRALLVTADPLESARWTTAAREDVSIDVVHAGSVADGLRVVRARALDVVIMSTVLPDGSHRDMLRELHGERDDVPAIVVGALAHDAIRDALALGAIDVVAAADIARLGPAIARALRDAVLAAMLRRARAKATLIDETLRRVGDEVAVVALDDAHARIVYATRPDLVGRPLAELPFVRDAEETEEIVAAVHGNRPAELSVAAGVLEVEPFSVPPYDRRFAAISIARGLRPTLDERDPLTGLPQRSAFERRAETALADAERENASVAVLFVDVDRFRAVNQLADHVAGDAVLRAIAERLCAALPDDYVARFGGDEFVVLRVENGSATAREAVEAVLAAFAEPFRVNATEVYLTASIGVSVAPDDAGEVAALIGTAEAAVFEAKRFGRNTVRWYAAPGASSSVERVLTRRDLQGAIERGEFELYYQPMYDVETRAIHGVEALIRWRHPVHGLVLPDRFIPVAEECGLIDAIGEWVLDRAVAQVRAWDDAGIPAVRVSVNVSARQFESGDLPGLVGQTLMRHDVAPSCLEIEITESSIMRDVTAAARLLRDLRELGVRVSIDDFGTGYTSLGFLKNFPVDVLKIDKTFVADVAVGDFDGAVIRAVTTLARGLGVRTVAEGVEVQAQFDRLRALDCDVVQGFLFSHPLTAAACTPLLLAGAFSAA